MATPQVKDLVLRSPAGSSEVVTFSWPLQIGSGQDKHDNGIDIIDTIKFVCEELPGISSAFEEINLNQIDTACYKTMTNLVDRFNKAVDSIVALEKGTSLPTERLNKFAHPSLLRHILQLVYNAAVLDPDKLNNYEPFSPEVYGETSYELVQQMIKHVNVTNDDTFIDLGSGVGQVVLQMAGSFPLKTCVGIEKADTPARYAERMDTYFRQFMAWFGKRYCDYKLLKGDFLVDEHREKITTSSLVFVNNFAFGPNVDHQLKERFADLRDGARIVSSKSFCPLNFRITDRNLSDIGTIMHLSEIPPLKGSVSWTCKPVSYYLHVIDRTILERYFQRLKTQKGAENENIGSTRTTRDRAKREANNQAALHNSNSNSNSATAQRTNSPATINNNIAAPVTKTRQQQQQLLQQQQQQQQRSLEMDTSTESDNDAATTNGGGSNSTTTGANTNGGSNGAAGPTTRKVWSDWCSSKGKSSQSDEENNNFSSTTNSRSARATTQKKRKKLTRKAAIASKSAAAAQREAAAREREAAALAAAANSKESSAKEDAAGTGSTTTSTTTTAGGGRGGGRKGRMKKGATGGRGKKSLKINGLDVLHKQTVLSTASDVMNKKLPTAPGCVDQKLTALLTANMAHEEIDIPASPQNTPYALQILLDVFRSQYMAMIEQMKAKSYVPNIKRQIQIEQERKQRIKNRASQLDKQIKVLIDDSVALLKVRMNELGINVSSPNDLIAKAKEIVGRHKELQGIAKKIQSQVSTCEVEQKRLLKKQLQPLPEYQKIFGNGKTKLDVASGGIVTSQDLSEAAAQELILREIANTLAQRKKLYVQVSNIEKEATALEQAADERRTAAALLAQGTNMTLTNAQPMAASANQPLQLTSSNATALTVSTSGGGGHGAATTKSSNHAVKSARRSRDHRTRSQEWPDVPDVGKIEESNPEVLAQKILETGRQIEAGKFTGTAQYSANSKPNNQLHEEQQRPRNKHQRSISSELLAISSGAGNAMFSMGPHDSALMPAPAATKNQVVVAGQATATSTISQRAGGSGGILPKCEFPGSRKTSSAASLSSSGSNNNIQESPKVANFEDRLKSIITSALNEDQEQRKATQHQQLPASSGLLHELNAAPSPQQSPAPKRSKHSSSATSSSSTSASQHLPPPQAPNNLSNIINVATQGLTHLNATTTISPITPPLAAAGPYAAANVAVAQHYNKYGNKQQTSSSSSSAAASSSTTSAQKYASNADTSSAKYHHHHVPPPPTQQQQHLNHMQQMHQSAMHQFAAVAAAGGVSADLAYHRRRSSVSAASSYEHFAAAQQQQQHKQALMLAAAAAAAQQQHQPAHSSSMLSLEFKAPTAAEHLQRSSSRDMLLDEANMAPRSSSANSDSAVMYFPPTRDRLMSLERSTSRESAVSQPLPPHHQQLQLQPSRPNSNSSQPDYTQVSPAKMALRRHLSQEKLNQQHPAATGSGGGGLPMSSKTIGDLVNGEIERTLEISHQSIINAVVNMSTVGGNVSTSSSGLLERSSYAERGGLFSERERERERERSNERAHERLLINPNAQRPERVHVRVIDDHPTGATQHGGGSSSNNSYAALEISPRSGRNESHNLSTLAHVAYNHKPSSGGTHDMTSSGGAISMKMSSNPNATAAATASRSNYNHRDSSAPYHHLPSSSSSSSAPTSGRGSVASAVSTSSTASTRRDYQAVSLPRAEMKGCIEAYFNEEQQQQQQHQQQHQVPPKSTKERSNVRNGRVNGGNPPLEGLAASLQDHVMASRKFKEEHEERQRRAAVAASTTADTAPHHYPQTHLGAMGATNAHHHQLHFQAAAASGTGSATGGSAASSTLNHNGTPAKVEHGIKRTSPVVAQHPRPTKIPHYSHEPPMQHQQNNVNSSQHHHQQQHHHPHQQHQHQQQQQQHQQHQQHNSTAHGLSAQMSHHAMMSAHNPYAHVNGSSAAVHSSSNVNSTSSSSSSSSSRRSKMSLELMSPEINSIMGDEARANLQISSSSSSSSSRQQQQTTPIVGGRAGDDDDVIADDETHWQHRVSSGFDRLVAFASTELDKTRRSIDTDTVPSSISCNTSPDSGITHSSSNSDAARTFLFTSSTCSQLEMPMGTSSNSFSSGYNNHHHVSHHHANDHLSDSSMKSTHSDAASSLAVTLKTTLAASPADASAIESPSLSDIGLPRTPSPNGAIATPPLAAATIAAAASKATADTASAGTNMQSDSGNSNTTLKIPLKYQRKSKFSSEKHYKKKFCERNWEYDCDELMAYSSSSSTTAADAAGTAKGGGGVVALEQQQQQLKADKSPKLAAGAAGMNESHATSGGGGDAATVVHNEATHMLLQHQHSNHYHSSTNLAAISSSAASQSHHHHQHQHQHQHHHHKSSKFRPKGKDWDWSLDSSSVSKNNKTNTPRTEAATTNSN